jgi:hypothetical protein
MSHPELMLMLQHNPATLTPVVEGSEMNMSVAMTHCMMGVMKKIWKNKVVHLMECRVPPLRVDG